MAPSRESVFGADITDDLYSKAHLIASKIQREVK